MSVWADLGHTLWLLARTARRFGRALETPLMVEAGAFPGLAYHVVVGLWMDWAGIECATLWNRRAFEFYGLLSEYSLAIDRFVDTAEGGLRFRADPALGKRHPDFARYIGALSRRLMERDLPRPIRRELARAIQQYRYGARAAVLRALDAGPWAGLEATLGTKEATSGAAFGTCADLLSIAHELPAARRTTVRTSFTAWGMALQISDDLADLALDYGRVQNVVVSSLLSHPAERARVEATMARNRWRPAFARETLSHVRTVFEGYLAQVRATGMTGRPMENMLAAARTLFWLGLAGGPARFFEGYVATLLHALGSRHQEPAATFTSLPQNLQPVPRAKPELARDVD